MNEMLRRRVVAALVGFTVGAGCRSAQVPVPIASPVLLRPRAVPQLPGDSGGSVRGAVSEDGAVAVTTTADAVYVWDVERGMQVRQEPAAHNVALSRNGKTLLLVDDDVRLCPLAERECVRPRLPISELVMSYGYQHAGFTTLGSYAWVCRDEGASVVIEVAPPHRSERVDGCIVGAIENRHGLNIYVVKQRSLYAVRSTEWPGTAATERLASLPAGFDDRPEFDIEHSDISGLDQSLMIGGEHGAYLFDVKKPGTATRLTTEPIHALTFDVETPLVVGSAWADVVAFDLPDSPGPEVIESGEVIEVMSGPTRLSAYGLVSTYGTLSRAATSHRLRMPSASTAVLAASSPDGRQLLASISGHVWRWDAADPRSAAEIDLAASPKTAFTYLRFLSDGAFVAANIDVRRVDLDTDAIVVLPGSARTVSGSVLAVSPDRKAIFCAGGEHGQIGTLWRWPFAAPQRLEIPAFGALAPPEILTTAAFSPSGERLITGGANGAARVWSTSTGAQLARFAHLRSVLHAIVGDDGRAITSSGERDVWNVAPWARLWSYATPDRDPHLDRLLGATLDATSENGTRALVGRDVLDARGVRQWRIPALEIASAGFSADGARLAVIDERGDALRIYDSRGALDLLRLDGVRAKDLAFQRPDLVRGVSANGVIHFWRVCADRLRCDARSSAEILQIIGAGDDWIAVDPNGRYDTSNFSALERLAWVLPDRPLEALPGDLFIRDYYVPGLVSRVLSGDALPPAADLSRVDRRVPRVTIATVKPDLDIPGYARVTLRIEADAGEAYDLHLLRDGNLVLEWPPPWRDDPLSELATWRAHTRVGDKRDRIQNPYFEIELPRTKTSVELNVYAFNNQRLKGPTATFTYKYEPLKLAAKPRAVIVTMGVGSSGPGLEELKWAPVDALSFSAAFAEALAGQYQVVQVPLVSASQRLETRAPCVARRSVPKASLGNLQAILARLQGLVGGSLQLVDAPMPCGLTSVVDLAQPGLERLGPDDVLVLYISAHGMVADGEFAFVTELGLHFKISELAMWLSEVASDHIVVVLDTCESGAAVASGAFRPAPLGDFTFGQLAFDKSMQILAASGANEEAVDSAALGGSLLVNALRERLAHGPVTAGALLGGAARDVPVLFRKHVATGQVQRPVVFDYRRGRAELVLGVPGVR